MWEWPTIDKAKKLLKEAGLLRGHYTESEILECQKPSCSQQKSNHLCKALQEMLDHSQQKMKMLCAIYTCTPMTLTFVIDAKNYQIVIIDTHKVPLRANK